VGTAEHAVIAVVTAQVREAVTVAAAADTIVEADLLTEAVDARK
jgi:hypothetical protein